MNRTATSYADLMDDVVRIGQTFAALATMIRDDDIDAAIATIDRADAVGSIFHPTAWIEAHRDKRLVRQRLMLVAFRDFKAALRKVDAT